MDHLSLDGIYLCSIWFCFDINQSNKNRFNSTNLETNNFKKLQIFLLIISFVNLPRIKKWLKINKINNKSNRQMYRCNDFIGGLKLGTNSNKHLKIRAYARISKCFNIENQSWQSFFKYFFCTVFDYLFVNNCNCIFELLMIFAFINCVHKYSLLIRMQ